MMARRGAPILVLAFSAAAAALLAGGCSPGDIALNGKVFDAIGATGALGGSGETPKMAARQPLVVPPSLDRLPQPGSGQPAAAPDLAGINDPDRAKKATEADLARQQAEYCRVNYEPLKQRGDASADAVKGPLGSCRGSVLSAVTTWNAGPKDDSEAGQ